MNKSLISFVAVILLAVPVFAQDPRFEDASRKEPSGWGFLVSFVPQWRASGEIKQLFSATAIDLQSDELRIGVARGRRQGSDWSLSYVRRKLKSGGTVDETWLWCMAECQQGGSTYTAGNDVVIQGAELSRYFNFGTIGRTVQLGMVVGVGGGTIGGRAHWRYVMPNWSKGPVPVWDERNEDVSARLMFPDWMQTITPLGRLELAAGLILAPGLKLRASGGVSFPGYHKLGITLVYLAGRTQEGATVPR